MISVIARTAKAHSRQANENVIFSTVRADWVHILIIAFNLVAKPN
jgi:hypothetical protein